MEAAAAKVHFAPFQPDAEDHLRIFTVSADQRRHMEENYWLALSMQKCLAGGDEVRCTRLPCTP